MSPQPITATDSSRSGTLKDLTVLSASYAPQLLLLVLVGLSLYRVLCILQPHMGLFYDEAYYFHWSQNPDWGYYSKPPMVAWVIAVTSSFAGATELGVKLGAPILYGATAWLIFLMGRKLAGQSLGIAASLVFITSTIVGFNSLFITTDAPLFFFWALASLMFLKCLERSSWSHWLILGVVIGCGTLSKYTFLALPLGFVCFAVYEKKYELFLSPKAWLSAVLALALLGCNIYWNWQHDFIAFTHTKEIAKLDGPLIKPISLLKFLLAQMLVLGLVWSVALLWRIRKLNDNFTCAYSVSFLWCTLLPILLVIASQALLSRAFVNWAGAFVVPASILVAAALLNLHRAVFYGGLIFNLFLLSLFYHWPFVLQGAGVEESKKNTPYYRLSGWQELSQQVEPVLQQYSELPLLSSSRDLLAYIGFYGKVRVDNLVYWNADRDHIENHYDLKNNIADYSAAEPSTQSYVFLSKEPLNQDVAGRFKEVVELGYYRFDLYSNLAREVYVYKLGGYQGYAD